MCASSHAVFVRMHLLSITTKALSISYQVVHILCLMRFSSLSPGWQAQHVMNESFVFGISSVLIGSNC